MKPYLLTVFFAALSALVAYRVLMGYNGGMR